MKLTYTTVLLVYWHFCHLVYWHWSIGIFSTVWDMPMTSVELSLKLILHGATAVEVMTIRPVANSPTQHAESFTIVHFCVNLGGNADISRVYVHVSPP